ncbi:hypothetical protein LCGC14_2745910 [marine sediment metagenome]|uniref:Uncharacterized protein n=1 Tax=marine sediment metagenome TaxID=412755 RepID=A0A0F8Z325_9ZZZZ
MPAWPAGLPQDPLLDGIQEASPDTRLVTQMEQGPPKVRRRFTAAERGIGMRMIMTTAQIETLDDFFVLTLGSGSLTFTWKHPRTGNAATYRFKDPPSWVPLSGTKWGVELALMITV